MDTNEICELETECNRTTGENDSVLKTDQGQVDTHRCLLWLCLCWAKNSDFYPYFLNCIQLEKDKRNGNGNDCVCVHVHLLEFL